MQDFPPEALIDGVPWWELEEWPGTHRELGDEPRIAAWLAFHKQIGETFTTDELRDAIGNRLSPESRNNREHFQRRVRELRSQRDGWVFPSTKHDRTIPRGQYRLDRIGWHPALGDRPTDDTKVSSRLRLQVIERDHRRCFHCGVISGEPYPDLPERTAVMTAGHIVPREFGGKAVASNLRAECSLCNESVRSATTPPESLDSVQVAVNNLRAAERGRLQEWIGRGHRVRDRVDEVYDRFQLLSIDDQATLADWLSRTS